MQPKGQRKNKQLDWNNHADQRSGATKFLQKTADDPQFRQDVLANPSYAREALIEVGNFASIPPVVQVICLGPSTQERARLVLFLLPESNQPVQDPLLYWIAAWPPYDHDPMPPGTSARTKKMAARARKR
jgi:hypothetical protein